MSSFRNFCCPAGAAGPGLVKRKKEAPLKIMAHSKNGGENGRKRCYNI
ncbi:hypothetical protein HMPREF1545_03384 [Oscillibacter sp. KLE 1728]|nr:hypothetical protein HMPREF1545_03384 [Oscillibacter sp. KLE 1728]ERK64762.1 hypothetical protein HMPREF1546_01619 [Oscillibacter sp. KLE 1745]